MHCFFKYIVRRRSYDGGWTGPIGLVLRTIGERLRTEREKRGIPIAKIAAELRIHAHYLEAIEEGDAERLPGDFFYRAFVRQYARYLNLNEEQIERDLAALRPPPAPPEKFPIEVPPEASSRYGEALRSLPWSVITLILVLAGGAAVYSVWLNRTPAETQPSPVAESRPSVSQPEPAPAPPPAAPTPAETPAAASSGVSPTAAPPLSAAPTAAAPAYLPPPQGVAAVAAAPPEAEGVRFSVLLSASEEVWVSLSSGGKTLALGTLKPGEKRRIEAAGSARLVVGNAGGIEVLVNDKPVGAIGPRGFPRTVILTPEGAQVLPPKPPAPPAPAPPAA